MRIGLNLLYLIPEVVGGTEVYGRLLVKWLARVDHTNDYFVFLNKEMSWSDLPEAPNIHYVQCLIPGRNRPLRYFWEQSILPCQLLRLRIDVVHSLGYVGPLITTCPSIVTIPDLNYVALKNEMSEKKRRILSFFSANSARRAARIIAISQFSKNEIVSRLGAPQDKVSVTYLGPGWDWGSLKIPWDQLQALYGLHGPYVTAFSGVSLHKNILRLVEAMTQWCSDLPHSLVLIGHLPEKLNLNANPDLGDRVVSLGYLPKDHIKPILNHADLFVMPSLYEGFGLPILEAQQAGVAVASSAAGALREIGGDGAVYFDPLSGSSIGATIRDCLSNPRTREKLIQLGRKNLKRFSWEATARQTLDIYQWVAHEQ